MLYLVDSSDLRCPRWCAWATSKRFRKPLSFLDAIGAVLRRLRHVLKGRMKNTEVWAITGTLLPFGHSLCLNWGSCTSVPIDCFISSERTTCTSTRKRLLRFFSRTGGFSRHPSDGEHIEMNAAFQSWLIQQCWCWSKSISNRWSEVTWFQMFQTSMRFLPQKSVWNRCPTKTPPKNIMIWRKSQHFRLRVGFMAKRTVLLGGVWSPAPLGQCSVSVSTSTVVGNLDEDDHGSFFLFFSEVLRCVVKIHVLNILNWIDVGWCLQIDVLDSFYLKYIYVLMFLHINIDVGWGLKLVVQN